MWLTAFLVAGTALGVQWKAEGPPILAKRFLSLRSPRNSEIGQAAKRDVTEEVIRAKHDNPFFGVSGRRVQIPFPFIGFLGTDFEAQRGKVKNLGPDKDRFGFRNPHDWVYDAAPKVEQLVVLLFGNSEAVGFHHKKSISAWLEQVLRDHGHIDPVVVNMAANGHSITHSWATYFSLGREMNPDVVIGYWGSVEHVALRHCAPELAKEAIFYNPFELAQAVTLGSQNSTFDWTRLNDVYDNDPETAAPAFRQLCETFRHYVEADGASFLVSMQKIDATIGPNDEMFRTWEESYRAMDRAFVDSEIEPIWFHKRDGIEMADNSHTTDATALTIANLYARRILKLYPARAKP